MKLLLLFASAHTVMSFFSLGARNPADPRQQQRASEIYPQIFEGLPSMVGKAVAITGASRGLGYVTALALAQKGAHVLLLSRPSAKAAEAHAAIAEAARVAGAAKPVSVDCNLLDFSSVRAAAAQVTELLAGSGGLDVLCLNAGIMLQPDAASKDGFDITASTNVLAHFLLTRELMPQLERAASRKGGECNSLLDQQPARHGEALPERRRKSSSTLCAASPSLHSAPDAPLSSPPSLKLVHTHTHMQRRGWCR